MNPSRWPTEASAYFARHAISAQVAERAGVRDDRGDLVLPWPCVDGRESWRRRSLGAGKSWQQEAGVSHGLWWPVEKPRPDAEGAVLICEGGPDALAALSAREGSSGDTGALLASALAGVAAIPSAGFRTDRLVEALQGFDRVVLALDGDEAGRDAAGRLSEALRGVGIHVCSLELPDGDDLADVLARAPDAASWLTHALLDAAADCPPVELERGTAGSVPDLGLVPPRRPQVVTARDFLARPRPALEPFVATPDGRSVLLAAHTTLLIAGPSGVGKSLVGSFDLGGRLASDGASDWLGLRVHGGRRVLLLAFEGSVEDNADRVRALVTDDARDRFTLWDEEHGLELPQSSPEGRQVLARVLREAKIDVLIIDTATAFFGSGFAVGEGEEAHAMLEELRARSGQRFAAIVVAHTKKADRRGTQADPLEEISGTFPRKADAAVVIRRAGEEPGDPRRHVIFAKVRRGPEPRTKIATLPTDPDAPPRLELVGDAGRPVKTGTDAEAMADWIATHDRPVAAGVVSARFNIGDSTLRRRRGELETLGIKSDRLPAAEGRGRSVAYGTQAQWRRVAGLPDEELGA